MKSPSHVQLFVTPWTVDHQAHPSMEFSRQDYWSGLPFPSPGDLPDPGIELRSPALQADALPLSHQGSPGSVTGSGRSPGEVNDNLLQYSYLENSMDRGAWQTIVLGVTKSQTGLDN